MLNHKTGFNNARLFYETDSLQMKAIKDIKQGEQIYNTYGDLCNSDLLRKYGFTDEKNEFDLVELDGPLIVEHCNVDEKEDEEVIEKKVFFFLHLDYIMLTNSISFFILFFLLLCKNIIDRLIS